MTKSKTKIVPKIDYNEILKWFDLSAGCNFLTFVVARSQILVSRCFLLLHTSALAIVLTLNEFFYLWIT